MSSASYALAVACVQLRLVRLEDPRIDVKGVLAFAEHLVSNLAGIWTEASLAQRQEIQSAIFPDGLPFEGESFGTATTCLMFNGLPSFSSIKTGVASPTGFEPVF